jgi:hypothetical protein
MSGNKRTCYELGQHLQRAPELHTATRTVRTLQRGRVVGRGCSAGWCAPSRTPQNKGCTHDPNSMIKIAPIVGQSRRCLCWWLPTPRGNGL